MSRKELVKRARQQFPDVRGWPRCSNEEIERALKTGVLPEVCRVAGEPGKDTLANLIAETVADYIRPGSAEIDESKVRAICEAVIEEKTLPRTIEVKVPDLPKPKKMGAVHCKFEELLIHVSVRESVFLVGPAGSGKTTTVEKVAEALGLEFYALSVGAQTSEFKIMGYMDASGNYVRTLFREAFEKGGVFCLDEIDAGNPNILTVINAALANGVCAFPDGMVKRHPDFVCIACGNTYGTGRNNLYIGRNQLDAATLDRFDYMDFPYDEDLERQIAGNAEWTAYVQRVRRAAEALALRVVISPRASIKGAKLLAAGLDRRKVEQSVLWKGLKEEDIQKIKTEARS